MKTLNVAKRKIDYLERSSKATKSRVLVSNTEDNGASVECQVK